MQLATALARGLVPTELSHIVVAERFGISPREVLEWPEELAEDVLMYLDAQGREQARKQAMRGR